MTRVLVVDDQRGARRSLCLLLQKAGYLADDAATGKAALDLMERNSYDVVVADLRLEDTTGIELLKAVRQRRQELPFIIITAYGTIESAVEAMRLGAFDYLTKPFNENDIIEKIQSSHEVRKALDRQIEPIAEKVLENSDVVATAPQMRAMLIRIERLARADISVLMTGETGTGKTKIARMIHDKSSRSARPFVSVNCASLPEPLLESELFGHMRGSFTGAVESRVGLFEEAHGGTIFLDEVDTLSTSMQAKLLHVFHDREIRRVGSNKGRPIDVRIICASNQDLTQLIKTGAFRADLYFRINGVRLHLPPLRERGNDISLLLTHFLNKHAAQHGKQRVRIAPRAISYILGYPYPGNIRQLESFVEQMVVFADDDGIIDIDALPEELVHPALHGAETPRVEPRTASASMIEAERELIEATLRKCKRLGEASKELGIGRTTLWRKIRQYGIDTPRRTR